VELKDWLQRRGFIANGKRKAGLVLKPGTYNK